MRCDAMRLVNTYYKKNYTEEYFFNKPNIQSNLFVGRALLDEWGWGIWAAFHKNHA